jgi:hypothetical protein
VVSYVDFWVAAPGVHGQESRLPMEDLAVPPQGARARLRLSMSLRLWGQLGTES